MNKNVLLFAWEYWGKHSKPGAALARRITQVAETFCDNGWTVNVIYNDHRNESQSNPYIITTTDKGIRLIGIKQTQSSDPVKENKLIRPVNTFLHVLFKGDRSNKWAKDVQREFANLKIPTPQLIIGFYTPRVPLTLAEYYAKQFNIPWFADLQDDLIDGIARNMHGFSLSWAKRVLKSAKTVIQVSPEWAKAEAEGLGRNVVCIRHVVPAPDNALKSVRENPPPLNNTFTIFYGGSINFNYQRLDILNQVSKQLPPDKKVVLSFAGTEAMYKKMEQHLEGNITLQNAGWLDAESYHRQVLSAHCCLVLPWALPPRQVIPSKFYEFCQYDKPIWIVGNDTGSFSSLFNEWQHPKIPTGDASYQLQTLLNALNGDYSGMFLPSRCQNAPLTEARLYEAYTKYL